MNEVKLGKWNIPCGCYGVNRMVKGVLFEDRYYCKRHEADFNLKYHGVALATNKEGKLVELADLA